MVHPNSIDLYLNIYQEIKYLHLLKYLKKVNERIFTDAIVELLSKSAGTFYKSKNEVKEMFPDNRPKEILNYTMQYQQTVEKK